MAFEPGREKTGGRQKGTPNRTTKVIRDILKDSLANQFDNLDNLLNELEPKERIDAIIKLSKYVLPSIKVCEVSMNSDETESIW